MPLSDNSDPVSSPLPVTNGPALSIIPLGGIGEIGLNSTVLEYGDDIIVIDAGLMFPDAEMLGVDIVIPDFTYLIQNRHKVRGVVITHAHEDHIGALPFFLREIKVPVYGTRLTLGFIKEKLKEHDLDTEVELITVKPRDVVELGCFRVEFIRVTHSIVDGCGLGITTPVGRVVHTGDFKIDPTPVDGEVMDLRTFSEYGDKGTLVLLSDSTNAGQGGYTFSEKEVRRGLEDIFQRAKGRIVVATFASNIHRVQQIVDVAVMFGRKVILNGKSMIANTQIALDLNYLKIPPDTWLKVDALKTLPDNEVVMITTGSQGEPMSALSRMAANEHKHFQIKKGDTIALSSKMIPGNERAIARIINHLFKHGAEVFYEKVSEIHVSGHASKEELKLMLSLIKPRYFIPVHGEYRHLVYHSQLAQKVNIPEENIFILEDGEVMEFTADTARRAGFVHVGRVYIDGKVAGATVDTGVDTVVLRDRMKLAHDGVVIVILGIEKVTGKVVSGPDIISRGFVFEDASQELIAEVRDVVMDTLLLMIPEAKGDWSLVSARVRSALKKFINKRLERRPMILPIIMEV
ncbi:MAG TPA: ribonuclease J [Nitrospirota bacterium]|nr:ribonuclease J [Nitrospirota bacterium]